MERTRERLARWRIEGSAKEAALEEGSTPTIAAVRADGSADLRALALVSDVEGTRLVAVEGGGVTVSPAAIARLVRVVDEGIACTPPEREVRVTLRRLRAWLRSAVGARSAAVEEIGAALLRRRATAHAADALVQAPRHERTRVARDAGSLIAAALSARGAGAERALEQAMTMGAFAPHDAMNDARPDDRRGDSPSPGGVLAVVLVLPRG
jgi:hypothetical protein